MVLLLSLRPVLGRRAAIEDAMRQVIVEGSSNRARPSRRPAAYAAFDRHQIPATNALGFEVVSPVEAW